MATAKERKAAEDRRDELFLEFVAQNLSLKEIANRLGVEVDYAGKLRRRLAPDYDGEAESPKLAFGISDRSRLLRTRLALLLAELEKKKHPIEIAFQTGVPQGAQRKNKDWPHPHDWKFSQLERLAELQGRDVIQLLTEALRPRQNGEAV